MEDKLLQLKNPDFMQALGSSLYALQREGHFCDLYLTCAEESHVVLHTCVAAAGSPFIKSLLQSIGAEGNKSTMGFAIPVPAVRSEIVELISQFMYTGTVNVRGCQLVELLNTADYFEIEALSELCRQEIQPEFFVTSEIKEYSSEDEVNALKRKLSGSDLSESEIRAEVDDGVRSPKRRKNDEDIPVQEAAELLCEKTDCEKESRSEKELSSNEEDPVKYEGEQSAGESKEEEKQLELSELVNIKTESPASPRQRHDREGFEDEPEDIGSIEETPEKSPVRFSKRKRGLERIKILDLIKKKKKKKQGNEGTAQFQEVTEPGARVVSEEEEGCLFDGAQFSCPLCEHTYSRKLAWVLHLDQTHDFEVESVTKTISDEDMASIDDDLALDLDIARFMESGGNSEEHTETMADFTLEERNVLIRLTKARKLQNIHSAKQQGLHKKVRVDKTCPVCNKFFKYGTYYDDHVTKHSDPKPYKCNLCPRKYATKSVYEAHMEIHANCKLKFECEKCPKSFASASRLRLHEECTHATGTALGCLKCDKTFRNKIALRNHVKAVHDVGTFTCDVCNKTMMATRKNEHMNLHTGEDLFNCDLCEAVYRQKSSLDNHRKTKHDRSDLEVHQCGECELTFATKQSLEKHLLRHTGNKKFTCSTCGQRFYTKGEVDQHEGYHIDPQNRPWTCSICRKSFTREYTLKSHMLVHSTDKPFTCEYCGKKFRWKNKLKEHIRIHTGEKPFKCRLCEARFPDCALRRHHEKKMHAEEIARDPSLIPKSASRSGPQHLDGLQRALIAGTYAEDGKEGIHIQNLSAVEVNPDNVFSLRNSFITIANDAHYPLLSSADGIKDEDSRIEPQFLILPNKQEGTERVQVATIENSGVNATFSNFVVVQNNGSFDNAHALDVNSDSQNETTGYYEFTHDDQKAKVEIMNESD